jgi:hypothetical protein
MEEEAVLHHTWFTDEAYFHVNGVVNTQNVRFWARELPHTMHEKENIEQILMCVSQFQPTESSVHFSFMTPSPKNDSSILGAIARPEYGAWRYMSVMPFEPQAPSVFTLLMMGIILFGACWRLCGITPAIGCTLSLASMV